jgi:hypothetical protein
MGPCPEMDEKSQNPGHGDEEVYIPSTQSLISVVFVA